ncbi:hypothetical protein ACHAXA_004422, partial [Cyclostephanos tholiformis]
VPGHTTTRAASNDPEQQQSIHPQSISQQQQQQQQDYPHWYAPQQQQPPPPRGTQHHHQIPSPMMRNHPQTPQCPPIAAGAGGGMGGGVRFGIVGRTPMTATSFGSSIGAPTPQYHHRGPPEGGAPSFLGHPGPPPPQAYRQVQQQPTAATSEMTDPTGGAGGGGHGGGGAAALVRGNDPPRPTSMVRRMGAGGEFSQVQQQLPMQQWQQVGMMMPPGGGGAPSPYNATPTASPAPFPHQQPQARRRQTQQRRREEQQEERLSSVKEEEDPSMLRYESRPGLDTSPMADDDKERRQGSEDGQGQGNEAGGTNDEKTGEKLGSRTPMPPTGHSRRVSTGQDLTSMATSSGRSSQDSTSAATAPPSFPGQSQRRPYGDQPEQADQTSGHPAMLQEFPFFFDGYAAWVCRHCHHIPSYYRGGNYVWQSSQPPPNHFVDMHLRFCPGLNPANLPPPAALQPHMPFHPPPREGGASFPYPMLQNPFMQHAQVPMFQQESLSKQSYGPQDEIRSPGNEQVSAPDPPGLSPIPPKMQVTDREQSDNTGIIVGSNSVAGQSKGAPPHGVHWDYPPGDRPPPFQHPHPYYPYPRHMMHMPPVAGDSFPLPHSSSSHGGSDMTIELSPSRNLKKRKASPSTKASPKAWHTDDATYKISKDFLTKTTLDSSRPSSKGSDLGQTLVDPTDADLLTDYFYHMLQQLVVCRFSEKDRKTRGGKRENIIIGYGGLQCIHCIDSSSARKFFWSNVDRLANSFAEIPSHILKCKLCPSDVRDALLVLKGRHHDQMQLLPRGSQKVFFRRMWRRLHDRDSSSPTPVKIHPSFSEDERGMDPPSLKIASPESALPAAASLLAIGSKIHLNQPQHLGMSNVIPDDKRQGVLLAIPEDKDWLSDMDCYVRKNIEVFTSTQSDVENAALDRKYPIKVGQVGIRCVHCARTSSGARSAAVSYPYSISGIYESVREFQRMHLETCPNIPKGIKEASDKFGGGSASLSSVLRRYYVQAARALGLFDTQDDGIGAGGKPVPVPTARYQSPESNLRTSANDPGTAHDDDNKRKASADSDDEVEEQGSDAKRIRLDAPGTVSKERDAPAKDEIPGMEDAPGEKVTICHEKEDAPGDKAADSP